MPVITKQFKFILLILILSSCGRKEEIKEEKVEITLTQFFENIPFHNLPYKDTINWTLDSAKLIPPAIAELLSLKEILKAKTTYHMDGSKFYILHKLNLSPDLNCLVICWAWGDMQLFNYLMIYDKDFKSVTSYGLSDDEIAESAFNSYSIVDQNQIETHDFNFFAKTEVVTTSRINKSGIIIELKTFENNGDSLQSDAKFHVADSLARYYAENTYNEMIRDSPRDSFPVEWINEDINEKGYYLFRIAHSIEDEGRTNRRFVTIQRIYVDPVSKTIFEYGLSSENLIEWKK